MNLDDVFNNWVKLWPNKEDREEAQGIIELLLPPGTAEDVLEAEKQKIESQLLFDTKNHWGTSTLEYYLRKKYGIRESSPAKISRKIETQMPIIAKVPSASSADFERCLTLWPKDPTRLPESVSNAKCAWERAVAHHGLENVKDAVALYSRKGLRLEHPLNMSTFLEGDDIGFLAEAQRNGPDQATRDAFELAYAPYPRKEEDQDIDLDIYHYRVAPEDRFEFLVASVVYSRNKADTEFQYIKRWSQFCTTGWKSVDIRSDRDLAVKFAAAKLIPSFFSVLSDFSMQDILDQIKIKGGDVEAMIALATKYLVGFGPGEKIPDDLPPPPFKMHMSPEDLK